MLRWFHKTYPSKAARGQNASTRLSAAALPRLATVQRAPRIPLRGAGQEAGREGGGQGGGGGGGVEEEVELPLRHYTQFKEQFTKPLKDNLKHHRLWACSPCNALQLDAVRRCPDHSLFDVLMSLFKRL